jgi:hypothetical protein
MIALYRTTRLTHQSAKKQCTDQGGKIEHEYKLVKGFTYVFHPRYNLVSVWDFYSERS